MSLSEWYLERNEIPQERYGIFQKEILIGRTPNCDMVLSHCTVSRNHCKIYLDDRKVYIEDLQSGNGTYINNYKLQPKRKSEIYDQDLIGIGIPPNHIVPYLSRNDHYGFKLINTLVNENKIDLTDVKEELILDLASQVSQDDNYINSCKEYNEKHDDNVQNNAKQILNIFQNLDKQYVSSVKKTVFLPDIGSVPSTSKEKKSKTVEKNSNKAIDTVKPKRKRKSEKSSSPVRAKISKDKKEIRSLKLKEIADKQNEEKRLKEKDANLKNKTFVAAKVTQKNRGSFLLNDEICPSTSTTKVISKKQSGKRKEFNLDVTLEDNVILGKLLQWTACWSKENIIKTEQYDFYENPTKIEEMPLQFQNYDDYKRILEKFILLEIWTNLLTSYNKSKKQSEYNYKNLHPIDIKSASTVIKIYLGPSIIASSNMYPKVYDMLLLKFELENITFNRFGIVKNVISNGDNKGFKILEVYIYWNNTLKLPENTIITLKSTCNIFYEVVLLYALHNLYNSPIRDMIVTPKSIDYNEVNFLHNKKVRTKRLNYEQMKAMEKCFGSKRNNQTSVRLINGLPGTGKTLLMCYMALEYLASFPNEGDKILICSKTNTGVDALLKQLLHVQEKYYKNHSIKIVRQGREDVMQPWAQKISIQKLAANRPTSTSNYNQSIDNENDVLEEADIIVTPLIWTVKLTNLKNKITWCLIDDASLANETEVLCPVSLNVKHFVLCGNIKQTSNTTLSERSLQKGFLSSLFSRMNYTMSQWNKNPVDILKQQHRMHPTILQWINKRFYENFLKPSKINSVQPLPYYKIFALPDSNEESDNNQCVSRITLALLEMAKVEKWKISIATLTQSPYQANVMRQCMQNLDTKEDNLDISSLENYTGLESDVVIVAPLKNPTNGEIEHCFVHAKHCLLICSQPSLAKVNNSWKEVWEDAKKRNLIVNLPSSLYSSKGARNIENDKIILKKLL